MMATTTASAAFTASLTRHRRGWTLRRLEGPCESGIGADVPGNSSADLGDGLAGQLAGVPIEEVADRVAKLRFLAHLVEGATHGVDIDGG